MLGMNCYSNEAPPLKLIDLPGLDQRIMDESMVSDYAEHNDAILLVMIPAAQSPEISSSRALRVAKECPSFNFMNFYPLVHVRQYTLKPTRTIGVISKMDQASADPKALAAVQALLLIQGPPKTADIQWVVLICQSVSIASAQSGSESSLETAWKAESEQIRKCMKIRVPNLLSGLQGKSQIVQDELVGLGEQIVQSAEGTRAVALELCRDLKISFYNTLQLGSGWKIVASFEGTFPNKIKQLPLDRHFDINNVKRVHCVLVNKVSASANATSGLGRRPLFKKEVWGNEKEVEEFNPSANEFSQTFDGSPMDVIARTTQSPVNNDGAKPNGSGHF
ncbi:hypothetical protein Pint_07093 [Pistacia integerrima]|uniref:Uncharacterized protein n=1 Tax=Pistacia integerrima TaxID=434235 RepID=A0ACC0XZN4_9ROSI|nr:hypothetical protein Pint_07093 [Pistacia integerrima]